MPPVAAAMLVAKGAWDVKTMVNVEELDPDPFIELLDKMGLPTQTMELQPVIKPMKRNGKKPAANKRKKTK